MAYQRASLLNRGFTSPLARNLTNEEFILVTYRCSVINIRADTIFTLEPSYFAILMKAPLRRLSRFECASLR